MFTGIIQAVGTIHSMDSKGQDLTLTINAADLAMDKVSLGDSIAVNGVCLTAVGKEALGFCADVSLETLSRSTLSALTVGSRVNLELALTPSTPLGGHLVSGHVDGVGVVTHRSEQGRSELFRILAPKSLAKYIAEKGSVSVDGISLTTNAVDGAEFDLNIVPHTLINTTMGDYKVGTKVNLEVDLIARYLERLMLGDKAAQPQGNQSSISAQFLKDHGFK